MRTMRQFDPLIIENYVTDVFLYAPHGHTYYELIYILKGNGVHILNNNRMTYKAGDLFLMSPADRHHFTVRQRTQFVVIKFTDAYFGKNPETPTGSGVEVSPQIIMQLQSLKETKLEFKGRQKISLRHTIENIIAYKHYKNLGSLPYVYFQILSVFALIKDVLSPLDETIIIGKADRQQLISYIHQHIYDPNKCQIKHIAKYFNISTTYFGDYFKRNFGISYREYINHYRTNLIQKRIQGHQMSMKEIAAEFGFSDESHFSNYFHKQCKLRPAEYRKQRLQ
jgi:AraC-like DNA-binding protein